MTGIYPRAEADIDEALGWYRERDASVAQRFLDELDVVFARIGQNPRQFPTIEDVVQRALLRKFPYSVYFVSAGELAAIIAVIHQRRRPVDWKPPRGGAG